MFWECARGSAALPRGPPPLPNRHRPCIRSSVPDGNKAAAARPPRERWLTWREKTFRDYGGGRTLVNRRVRLWASGFRPSPLESQQTVNTSLVDFAFPMPEAERRIT